MNATALAKTDYPPSELIEQVVIRGDLRGLSSAQKTSYYAEVCRSVGLNPLTRPLEYITLNGKETLYARKDCTDQLRQLRGISIAIMARETVEGVYVVTARATDKAGRQDESIGAVYLGGKKGDDLANAMMKAETKAKRRVTLSVCGLGLLDETELETIPKTALEQRSGPNYGALIEGIALARRLEDLEALLPALQATKGALPNSEYQALRLAYGQRAKDFAEEADEDEAALAQECRDAGADDR